MDEEVLNLDGYENPEDLLAAVRDIRGEGRLLLRKYAKHKARAMELRKQGQICDALWHEDVCHSIYLRLPERLR